MATTDFSSLTAAQKEHWAVETFMQGRDESFWDSSGLVGQNTSDHNKPVHLIDELSETIEGAGSKVTMQIVHDLAEDGIAGDQQLTGNEERMVNEAQTIQIDMLRHGVKKNGRMSEQKTVTKFRTHAKGQLAFWLADTVDELQFLTAAGRAYTLNTDGSTRASSTLSQLAFAADVVAASSNRIIHAGSATSEATITASDTMDWDLLVDAKAKAGRKKIRPIRSGGKSYYVVIMSTEQMRDLRKDADFKSILQNAGPRGKSNPLFTGAECEVEGLILYEHNKVYNTQGLTSGVDKWGSGSNVDGAQAMLLGAQAMGKAMVTEPFWEEADINDYKNQPGIAYGQIFGLLKPQFEGPADGTTEDYGVLSIKTAAAAVA